jgi:hypothetical protein
MIRTIPHETIMTYMAGNYRASRMILSVPGNIDEAAVLAESQFGSVAASSDLYQEPARFGGGERRASSVERDSKQVRGRADRAVGR